MRSVCLNVCFCLFRCGYALGILLEACIAQSGAFTYFKNWENVFSGADKLLAITGLYFYQCSDDENK